MNTSHPMFLIAIFGSLVVHAAPAADPASLRPLPNIILMMADDMGMGDTSAYQDYTGNSDSDQIATPNMERLARIGVRFTDAHTPASRCTLTRYSLLTGRYSWRSRLKHWVLFGVQGDPMIERDRPTIASMLRDHGYSTGLVGKWHVGLRYRTSTGEPADAWEDADLTQPMFDTPLDHGFDFCRFTSRSHATSGPAPGSRKKRNDARQSVGPGHIHGRDIVGATGDGKKLVDDGPNAYVLNKLGGRHFSHAKMFINDHLSNDSAKPFFLYYASNSNHGPYTPDLELNGVPVAGASKNVTGESMDVRSDFVYENDVALGQLIDHLQNTDDPRNEGHKLIHNTIVIFTSDNGAEKALKRCTGPFRSHKGSVYEGGHRVPFLVTWPQAGVGDGDESTEGRTESTLIGLQDMYATFQQIAGGDSPAYQRGETGGEDSFSVLTAWQGNRLPPRVMFFNDHKEADDHAVVAFRQDDPIVNGETISGQWKIFFDARLLRSGEAVPVEIFDLATDPQESRDRLEERELQGLVESLTRAALEHRTAAGHRLVPIVNADRIRFDWLSPERAADETQRSVDMRKPSSTAKDGGIVAWATEPGGERVQMTLRGLNADDELSSGFDLNGRGLGIVDGRVKQVDEGEALEIEFDRDVLIESAEIIAGNGVCGGFYRVGERAPLAIYCIDADIDSNDQAGILSDIGVLLRGQTLRLDSRPHLGAEAAGQWRLGSITIRTLKQ